MKKHKAVETDQDLINALADLFDEVNKNATFSEEEVDITLREAGYDPEQVVKNMQTIADQALANSPLNWRNRAPKELKEAKAKLQAMSTDRPLNKVELKKSIQQLLDQLSNPQKQAFAHFRNFESMSDEDLASLLNELEFLTKTDMD